MAPSGRLWATYRRAYFFQSLKVFSVPPALRTIDDAVSTAIMKGSKSIARRCSMIWSFSLADHMVVYLADASKNPTKDTAIDKMAMDSWTTPRPPASDVEYWNGVAALMASRQFCKYPLTAPRTIFRRGGNLVPSDKSADVKSCERVSHGDGVTPWRNGEERNSWVGDSGRYRDNCAAS